MVSNREMDERGRGKAVYDGWWVLDKQRGWVAYISAVVLWYAAIKTGPELLPSALRSVASVPRNPSRDNA